MYTVKEGNMVICLPCRLGERFIPRKFTDWVDGKRVYKDMAETTLNGFFAFDCNTSCLSIPTLFTSSRFVSYDPAGEFSQEFVPKYKISIDVKSQYKLSDRGFQSKQTARLCGLKIKSGVLYAEFVTSDRYEHLIYPIKDVICYSGINENPPESKIEFCKIKEENEQLSIFDLNV